MDAKDLKVFEVVARHQGMKRAAQELNTVQSNVTVRVRALEEELGVALFERRPDGMKLTPAGIRLLPYAYEVRAALDNARHAATDSGTPRGPLLIGCRKTTSALHLTRLLAKYLDQFPEVDVKVRTETSPLLTDLVLKRRIEGALACNPIKHPDLISEVILDEELVVLTAPHIRKLGEISPDTRLIVLGQGSLYQDQLRAILIRQGIEVTRVMELGTLEVIVGCVACGLGVTLLPRAVLDLVSPKGSVRAHSVMDEDCRVQTLFVRRRNAFVSSALSAFLDCARAYSSRHNPGTRANLVMSAKAAF